VDGARLDVDLGRGTPQHDRAVAALLLHEAADVLAERLAQRALCGPLLHVGPVEPLHVVGREDGGHRLDGRERLLELVEEIRLEDLGVHRRVVRRVGEHVPPAEPDVRQLGERNELLHERRAPLGPLAEPDPAHLRHRPDRLRHAAANGLHAGDQRRRDRTHPGEEQREATGRRRDVGLLRRRHFHSSGEQRLAPRDRNLRLSSSGRRGGRPRCRSARPWAGAAHRGGYNTAMSCREGTGAGPAGRPVEVALPSCAVPAGESPVHWPWDLGLLRLRGTARHPKPCELHEKGTGEPDAGNPHARLERRRVEAGRS
jgi:hypothetical protein